MRKFISGEELLNLIKDGEWELGYFDGIRSDGMYQVQKGGLMTGGETLGVRANTVKSLERRLFIMTVPREPKQPYWVTRYRYRDGAGKSVKPEAKGKVDDR